MKSESIPTKLRVCVVGAGKMGAGIERLTRRIVGAEVSACRRRRFARKKGCRSDSLSCGGLRYQSGFWTRRMSTQSL